MSKIERPYIHVSRPRISEPTQAERVGYAQRANQRQRKGVKITLPEMPPRISGEKK